MQVRGLLPAASTEGLRGAEGRQDGGLGLPAGRDEAAVPRQSLARPALPRSSPMPGLASSITARPLPANHGAGSTASEKERSPCPAAQLGSNHGKKHPRT